MGNDRIAVLIACAALVIAVIGAALSAGRSTADFVVDSVSRGNQFVTLDPQPAATFAAPDSEPDGVVVLAWTASDTAALRSETTYSVHRSPAGANTWTRLASGLTALTYTDTPASDGSYDYKIRTDVSTLYADTAAQAGLSDRADPGITAALSPVANANGWNKADVIVTFTCSDSGSAVATCTSPVTVSTEGASNVVNGAAADNAGNTSSTSVTVKLDKTLPTISGSASPAANTNGWRNSDVTVSYSCDDALSGISTCTSPQTLSSDGANQSSSGTAVDAADNSAGVSVTGINLDKTRPSAATGLTSKSGPLLGAATVDLSWIAATDATSGLAGYTLYWTTATLSCPATPYSNSVWLGNVTSYSFGGSAATSYCFYLVTKDLADNTSVVSAVTGPTLAE